MFRKTESTPQLDLFTAPSNILPRRAQKKYTDEKAWHNQFFKLVTSRIDEESFRPLFEATTMGAPNASVRILVAMSILKEGFGCSDEDLFEKCEFDLLARRALGLEMLDDKLPSLDTYYLFGRRLTEYEQRTGINLMERCFEQVTGEQVKLFKISGSSVRMDSKLIGSNIAQYSRYELIHRTLCKVLRQDGVMTMLNPKLRKGAEVWLGEDSGKTVYRSNKDEMAQRLVRIGLYIYAVLKRLKDDAPGYDLLHRVFHDQYVVEKGRVELKDKHKVASDSLQSPDDPDATYRDKGGQKVSGYVTNITETIESDKPSIITSVQTEPVTFADCNFLQDAISNTERVTGHLVENVYADGAYQSPENREFARLHMGMELLTGKLQGGCRYLLDREHGTDNLKVTDTETGEVFDAIYVGENKREGKHWRVNLSHVKPTHPWRYFNEDEVRRSELRRKIESLPPEEQHKRNNIEAAMFQYSFHTRNGKTRYRGLFRHRLQAFHRCMWMNLRRLVLFQTTISQRPLPEPASSLIGKTEDYISSLIKAVSDPMKVFCEYLMLVVEKSVWSVLKLRLSTSEQMFNLNATF
jgi:IS5 family transposase